MIPGNLTINADDFGLDARVSAAIALCLDEGLINSFSVYPFQDAFHADLLRSILVRHPRAKVGAHLAVIDAALKDHPGHFRDFLARYLTGRMPPAKIRSLWRAQIETLGALLGGTDRIAHLDSHQHLHVLPGLWPEARSLQMEYGIPRLRVPYESLRRAVTYRFPFGLGLQALAFWRSCGAGKAPVPGFLGFFTSTRFTLRENHAALERVRLQPWRGFELMVHPALPASGTGGIAPGVAASQELEIAELRLVGEFFRPAAPA